MVTILGVQRGWPLLRGSTEPNTTNAHIRIDWRTSLFASSPAGGESTQRTARLYHSCNPC